MATTSYYTADLTLRIGGVDMSGVSHPELVPDEDGVITVPDDEGQTYDQSIRGALGCGLISDRPVTKRRKET